MFNNYDDEIWDEHQWEAHLNEIEKQNTRLQKFIAPESPDRSPRWLNLVKESDSAFDAVDAFIEEELRFDDSYFSDESDDDDFDDSLWEEWEEDLFLDEEDDFDAGEEWKELSDDFALTNNGSIEMLSTYNRSRKLAAAILQWAEATYPHQACSNLVEKALHIGAKIAGGYSFGFEHEFLGGNIAYTKRALYCANDALTILQRDLKDTDLLTRKTYRHFHEQIFELRNDIGIYIQELREAFYDGV